MQKLVRKAKSGGAGEMVFFLHEARKNTINYDIIEIFTGSLSFRILDDAVTGKFLAKHSEATLRLQRFDRIANIRRRHHNPACQSCP